jgi:kynurenine formamidase
VTIEAGEAVLAGKALLLRARPKLVGVDCWNVDDIDDQSRRVHTALLRERILIVEHLCNLGHLPCTGFRCFAVPLRLAGGASFPVRAFAEVAG